jgi:hypothetical protein
MEHESSLRPDALIQFLAARQNGVVYRGQLLAAGLTHGKTQVQRKLLPGCLCHRDAEYSDRESTFTAASCSVTTCGPVTAFE